MLAMALPIASPGYPGEAWRDRLSTAPRRVIMAAVLATQRKTGILAPLSVVLTLAYFRRRELLRIADRACRRRRRDHRLPGHGRPGARPVQTGPSGPTRLRPRLRLRRHSAGRVDPSGTGPRLRQLSACRPSHPRLRDPGPDRRDGRDRPDRVPDAGCLVVDGAADDRVRHPVWSPPALVGAAAAVVFLVVAALFDTMSFPQVRTSSCASRRSSPWCLTADE